MDSQPVFIVYTLPSALVCWTVLFFFSLVIRVLSILTHMGTVDPLILSNLYYTSEENNPFSALPPALGFIISPR